MALDDHLGSQKDIRLLGREGREDFFIASLAPGRIRVHAQDPGLRKGLPEKFFYLFCSGPHGDHVARAALGTGPEGRSLIAAVVADQPPVAVQREGDVAVGAFCHKAAAPAGDKTRKSAAVDKEHALLALAQAVLNFGMEAPGEHGLIALLQLLAHIHGLHRGKPSPGQPLTQTEEADLPVLSPPVGFQGRRRRSQHQDSAVHFRDLLGHLPGLVFGHGFIFIASLMLLVDHDHAGAGKGGKEGAAGADDHIDLTSSGPLPLVCPLRLGERGVDHADPVAEMTVKTHERLEGQGDLRDQHDCLPAPRADFLNDGNIDFRLAAAGDPVDETDKGKFSPGGFPGCFCGGFFKCFCGGFLRDSLRAFPGIIPCRCP